MIKNPSGIAANAPMKTLWVVSDRCSRRRAFSIFAFAAALESIPIGSPYGEALVAVNYVEYMRGLKQAFCEA